MSDEADTDRQQSTTTGEGDGSTSDTSSTTSSGGMSAVMNHFSQDKIEAGMWMSRVVTIFFTVSFVLPFFGVSQYTSGQRVLIAGAITSALRLHQRMPQPRLNREFLAALVAEDSAHYLIYSVLILYTTQPVSMVLMPVFLFALLHFTKYTKTLLDLLGPQSLGIVRRFITKIDTNQRMMLKLIATIEITMMPTSLLMIIGGQAALLLPFGYYRFLCMRYTSVRNPYSRTVFNELRLIAEHLSRHDRCPAIGATIIHKIISLTCRMSPAQTPAAS